MLMWSWKRMSAIEPGKLPGLKHSRTLGSSTLKAPPLRSQSTHAECLTRLLPPKAFRSYLRSPQQVGESVLQAALGTASASQSSAAEPLRIEASASPERANADSVHDRIPESGSSRSARKPALKQGRDRATHTQARADEETSAAASSHVEFEDVDHPERLTPRDVAGP